MTFKHLIDRIPDYTRFYTVDEFNDRSYDLAKEYPHMVEIFEGGKSRNGDSIPVIKIGKGKNNALLFGCPHPNEPIGAMMLDFFSRALAEDEELLNALDYTWYIIKVIDPDGTKLNEGWFNDSSSIKSYATDFYRPPGHEQIEWTFPVEYKTLKFDKPLPETQVLMNLIKELKPVFMYSLHNAGFGGVYYYITEESPELYKPFSELPGLFSLPLSLGEPESPFLKTLAPAIYGLSPISMQYDYMEKHLDKDPCEIIKCGTCSDEYAKKIADTFTLVCELPYYYDSRIEDLSESDTSRKKAKQHSLQLAEESVLEAISILKICETEIKDFNSPFKSAVTSFLDESLPYIEAEQNWVNTGENMDRPATEAEKFDNLVVSRFYHSLIIGMLVRYLKGAYEVYNDSENVKEALSKATVFFDKTIQSLEDDLDYKAIPIKSLVGVQLLAGLETAKYVLEKRNKK